MSLGAWLSIYVQFSPTFFVLESLKNVTTLDLSSNRISSLGTTIVNKTVIKYTDRQTDTDKHRQINNNKLSTNK